MLASKEAMAGIDSTDGTPEQTSLPTNLGHNFGDVLKDRFNTLISSAHAFTRRTALGLVAATVSAAILLIPGAGQAQEAPIQGATQTTETPGPTAQSSEPDVAQSQQPTTSPKLPNCNDTPDFVNCEFDLGRKDSGFLPETSAPGASIYASDNGLVIKKDPDINRGVYHKAMVNKLKPPFTLNITYNYLDGPKTDGAIMFGVNFDPDSGMVRGALFPLGWFRIGNSVKEGPTFVFTDQELGKGDSYDKNATNAFGAIVDQKKVTPTSNGRPAKDPAFKDLAITSTREDGGIIFGIGGRPAIEVAFKRVIITR